MARVPAGSTNNPTKARIGIFSFGEKCDVHPHVQFEFDVTKFRDPAGQVQFRSLRDGTHADVRKWMEEDDRLAGVVSYCKLLANDLIKPKTLTQDGRTEVRAVSAWLSISFKDFHGKWAAPAIAEIVADALADAGYDVAVTHSGLPSNG